MAAVLATVVWAEGMHLPSWYGIAVFVLLVVKLAASIFSRPVTVTEEQQEKVGALNLAAVITVYNEDADTLARCLEAVLKGTRLPDSIVVVDDGSTDRQAVPIAHAFADAFLGVGVDYQVIEFPENRGKREGLAAGFNLHPEADVFLGIDSDTEVDVCAIEEGMKPFASRRVNAVTGLVLALNARKNLLTRLIDLRYANAFLYERAAYSLLGSVLCCCGSLAFYRASVVRENLDDFLNQIFLGKKATYGDDRRLTNYCLKNGRVVFQSSAVAWTLVPERVGHYLKQQIRWNKSFFRESLSVIQTGRMDKPAFWLSLLELTSWISFTSVLIYALVMAPLHFRPEVWALYLMYAMVLGYARSVRYLEAEVRTKTSWRERLGTFFLAPLYGLLHMTVLLWVRLYALATLTDTKWGTRTQGVEVGVDGEPKDTVPA